MRAAKNIIGGKSRRIDANSTKAKLGNIARIAAYEVLRASVRLRATMIDPRV